MVYLDCQNCIPTKYMKKTLLFLTLCNSALLGEVSGRPVLNNGTNDGARPYIGFNIGHSVQKTKFKHDSSYFFSRNTVNARGLEKGFLVGSMYRRRNTYIATECWVNINNNKGSSKVGIFGQECFYQKITHNYNIQLRGSFGYIINNFVAPKIIFGLAHTKFTSNLSTLGCNDRLHKNNMNYIVGGVGIDLFVTPQVVYGMEYITSFCKKDKFNTLTNMSYKMNYKKLSVVFKYLF